MSPDLLEPPLKGDHDGKTATQRESAAFFSPSPMKSDREPFPFELYILNTVLAAIVAVLFCAIIGSLVTLGLHRDAGAAFGMSFRFWPLAWVVTLVAIMIKRNHKRLTSRQLGRTKDIFVASVFLLPNITGFMIFTLLPVAASLILAFCRWDMISGATGIEFVGLNNFKTLLGFTFTAQPQGLGDWLTCWRFIKANDADFWRYLWNTIFFMFGIPVSIFGSLVLAIILNNGLRGRVFMRTLYFLPSMCVPVAVFLLWRWLYNPDYGYINWSLNLVGLKGPNWLSSPNWAKPAIMIAGIWMGVGGPNMILYLAGLQSIPRDYYEAATIDGASPWQSFRHITWPLLSPTTFFILIMSVIGGFQGSFESAYIMTGGGPAGSTTAISFYIYNNAFRWFKMGYASAIAWVLFLIILIITIINYRYGGRRVQYY